MAWTKDDLVQMYNSLAHTADQRLVRLERLAMREGYGDVLGMSYGRAMRDIQAQRPNGRRFRTGDVKGWDVNELHGRINDVQRFLNSKTSTKRDVDKLHNDRLKKFNKTMGTNLNLEQFVKYMNSAEKERVASLYGSAQLGKAVHYAKDVQRVKANARRWQKRHNATDRETNKRIQEKLIEVTGLNPIEAKKVIKIQSEIRGLAKYYDRKADDSQENEE